MKLNLAVPLGSFALSFALSHGNIRDPGVTLKIDNTTVVLNASNAAGFVVSVPSASPVTITSGRAYTIGTDIISLGNSAVVEDHSTIAFPHVSAPTTTSTINSKLSSITSAFSSSSRTSVSSSHTLVSRNTSTSAIPSSKVFTSRLSQSNSSFISSHSSTGSYHGQSTSPLSSVSSNSNSKHSTSTTPSGSSVLPPSTNSTRSSPSSSAISSASRTSSRSMTSSASSASRSSSISITSSASAVNQQPVISTLTSVVSGTTQLIPVIVGGAFTTPVPLATTAPPTSLVATGTVASSSASALSSMIVVGVLPIIKDWTDNPSTDTSKAINAIKGVLPEAEDLMDSLGGGNTPSPCSSSKKRDLILAARGLIPDIVGDIIHSVACITNTLNKISGDITAGVEGVEGVKADVDDLTSLTDNLSKDENDDNKSNSENSASSTKTQSESKSSSGSSSSSTTSSGCPMSTLACADSTNCGGGLDQVCSADTNKANKGCSCQMIATAGEADIGKGPSFVSNGASETALGSSIYQQLYVGNVISGMPALSAYFSATITSNSSSAAKTSSNSQASVTSGKATVISTTHSSNSSTSIPTSSASSSASQTVSGSRPTLTSISKSRGSSSTLKSKSSNPGPSSSSSTTTRTTSAPPITSCTMSSVAALSTAYSFYTIDYPATIECSCNDGWTAGVANTVGSDGSTTYYCEISTTHIEVSTAPPKTTAKPPVTSTAPPPYVTGTCDLHIYEASNSYNEPLFMQFNITDGGNNLLASESFQGAWGETGTVKAADSKLPYDVSVDFLKSKTVPSRMARRSVKGRMVGPTPVIPVAWEDWVLTITAGGTKWDDTDTDSDNLPYCSVGGWDNGNFWDWLDSLIGADSGSPNRQLDCHWAC